MIKAIISDFSKTLLFPKDTNYNEGLNKLYKEVKGNADFKFFNYFKWNEELGDFYNKLMPNYQIYIFTTDTIQEDPALEKYLAGYNAIFNVKAVNGLTKDNPEAYKTLGELLSINTSEILFIDDSDVNINAAQQAGMNTIQYSGMLQFKLDFDKLLSL